MLKIFIQLIQNQSLTFIDLVRFRTLLYFQGLKNLWSREADRGIRLYYALRFRAAPNLKVNNFILVEFLIKVCCYKII